MMSTLLVLAIVLQQPLPAPAGSSRLGPEPRIEWAALPASLPQQLRDSVRFGFLEVPQDHADPAGARIRLALLFLPARSATPELDPVVAIGGGPGLPAIELHMRLRRQGTHPLDAYRDRRNLVVIDARGHGFSEPATCPELQGAEPMTETDTAEERRWVAALVNCRRRLESEGVRLAMLSSVQVAHDLELLRRALGAPRLNLVGTSYGSRIAAEAIRQTPAALRAVYLRGPVPAGLFGDIGWPAIEEEIIEVLFARCAAQRDCAAAYPRLRADHDSVLARLRRAPARLQVPRSGIAPAGTVVLDAALMQQGFAQILLNRRLAAGAPLLIHTLAVKGPAVLGPMAAQLTEEIGDPNVSTATFQSFWCNDGAVTRTSSELRQQRCRALLGPAWDGRRAEPVRGDVPILIETGEFDPRTPPSYARFLAAGLSRSHVLITPWYGHERPSDCSLRVSAEFLDQPGERPDAACLDSIPPVEFVTGVVPSRWVGAAVGRVVVRPWLAALPGAAALLLLVPAAAFPVRELRARRRGARGSRSVATLGLWLVAVTGSVLVLGLAAALVLGFRRHFFIPAIGLPVEWSWLLALPWLLLALTPVAVFVGLRGRTGSLGPPTGQLWASLGGAALLLALWAVNALW